MSKKKFNEIKTMEEEISVPEKAKISFQHWFDKQIKSRKVRDWQEEGLLVFMKKKGLSELEDEDLYNESFKKF